MNNTLPEISKISGRDLAFKRDRETKKTIETLKQCAKAIDNFSDWLYKELDVPVNKKRRFVAGVVNSLVPARFRDYLPGPVAEFVAAESHASYFMESHLRTSVNNTMEVAKNLAKSASHEEEQLNNLLGEIEKAEEEKWGAGEIQDRLVELVNDGAAREEEKIVIDEEIKELLGDRSELLTPEEKEKRRLQLLSRLRANAAGRKKLVQAKGKICILALETLEAGVFQLFDFLTVIRPLRVIESAARNLTEMDKSMYIAKDTVIKMAQISAVTLGNVADAVAKVEQYAISGRDTAEVMEAVNQHIQKKLLQLEEARTKVLALEDKRQKIVQTLPAVS